MTRLDEFRKMFGPFVGRFVDEFRKIFGAVLEAFWDLILGCMLQSCAIHVLILFALRSYLNQCSSQVLRKAVRNIANTHV